MGPECESCLVRVLCFRVSYKTAVQVSARIKVLSQDIVAFELWCWRRLLRVPWTARRSNQSILREVNSEGLMLKLKPQYFGDLM